MKRRGPIFALLVTLAGAALLHLYMRRFEQQASGGEPIAVLMLRQDLPLGAIVGAEVLGTRTLPSSYVESRHIRADDRERVIGVRISVAGRAGEALLWSDLSSMQAKVRQLSDLVPEGLRAITVRAKTSSMSGLIRPGDQVDLLWVSGAAGRTSTRTLLQALLVLAVGEDLGELGEAPSTGRGQVTLAVSAADAQRIAQAEQLGTLRVVLRNPEDTLRADALPPTTTAGLVLPQATPPVRHGG